MFTCKKEVKKKCFVVVQDYSVSLKLTSFLAYQGNIRLLRTVPNVIMLEIITQKLCVFYHETFNLFFTSKKELQDF